MGTLVETTPVAIQKGMQIKVVGARGKGEKAPKGTVGRVFWIGETAYTVVRLGTTTYTTRIGFETTEGKRYFTPASNVVPV